MNTNYIPTRLYDDGLLRSLKFASESEEKKKRENYPPSMIFRCAPHLHLFLSFHNFKTTREEEKENKRKW